MLSQSQKKPKVTSAISQHLLRSYHNFYSRTFPEFFTCEKNAGLTGLVSLPTQKQQCKLIPQCHINRSWVTILKEIEVRDCTLGPFNPSSVRRPKKGHTGIKNHFTKVVFAFSQGTEWNSSPPIIQASRHQLPFSLCCAGPYPKYCPWDERLHILSTVPKVSNPDSCNYSFNRLLNLQHDSPLLQIPMGTCSAVWCSWKQSCYLRLCFSPLRLLSILFLSHKLVILFVQLPYNELMTDSTLSSLLEFSTITWFWVVFSALVLMFSLTVSYSPRCWREPFSRCEEVRLKKYIFLSALKWSGWSFYITDYKEPIKKSL